MKTIAVVSALLFGAQIAAAQCVCDADNSDSVEINELVQGVGNSLSGCVNTLACPIDFADDNTQVGTPDCIYVGRWNQTCGAADLETRWISDLADMAGEEDIVVVDLIGFDPPLFYGAATTSPTTADLIGWFRTLDASDLTNAPGTLTLGDGGRTLVVAPDAAPFQVESCDFMRYDGALSDVVQPSTLRAASRAPVSPAAFERLRAARPTRPARPNLLRK